MDEVQDGASWVVRFMKLTLEKEGLVVLAAFIKETQSPRFFNIKPSKKGNSRQRLCSGLYQHTDH